MKKQELINIIDANIEQYNHISYIQEAKRLNLISKKDYSRAFDNGYLLATKCIIEQIADICGIKIVTTTEVREDKYGGETYKVVHWALKRI